MRVHSVLFSGYGHKTVTFKVDHPNHKFEDPYTFKVVSTDMELFDKASDLTSDESDKLIIETLIGDSFEFATEIAEWLQSVDEKREEQEEA
jgi:hypothetical protein